MATYLETYQFWLEDQLAGGGKPAHMETCVNEYNATGRANYTPGAFYGEWSGKFLFLCSTCQGDFYVPEGSPSPAEEVTCPKCETGAVERGTVEPASEHSEDAEPPA